MDSEYLRLLWSNTTQALYIVCASGILRGIEMGHKVKTSIALDEDLLSWVEEMVRRKRFANRTHAIEYALQRLKEQEIEELHIRANL